MVFKRTAAVMIAGALLVSISVAASAETVETVSSEETVETVSSEETESEETQPTEDSEGDFSALEGLDEWDMFCAGIDTENGSLDGSVQTGSSWELPDSFSALYYECTVKSDGTISICCKDNSWGEAEFGETLTIPAKIGGYTVSEIGGSFGYSFKEVKFESGPELKTIGESAFSNWASLETISIPDSVETIDGNAFYYCEKLKEIKFGDGSALNQIGDGAFAMCTSLKSITLPKNLENIVTNSFFGCTALTEINVDENNENMKSIDGVMFTKDGTTIGIIPPAKKGKYEVPAGVAEIAAGAFANCTEITSVIFPEGVTEIPAYTFYGCSSLTEISLPASVETIGDGALDCPSLTKINIDENNKTYKSADGVLYSKDGKTLIMCLSSKEGKYEIPEGVTEILTSAFASSSLTEVKLPQSLTTLGEYCFSGSAIISIDIPGSVAGIPMGAFGYCRSLAEVKLHEGLKTIGANCFASTLLKSIDIPSSVTEISPDWCKYTMWNPSVLDTKIETINGVAGSYAETFAKDNGITFKSVSSVGGSGSTADTDKDKTDNGTADKGTSDKGTPEKGSPDTGIPEVAAALGVVALAGAFVIISGKKR